MRKLHRNYTITILGQKVGNTYIKTKNGCYSLTDTKDTKQYADYVDFWWILKKQFFQWKVVKAFRVKPENTA